MEPILIYGGWAFGAGVILFAAPLAERAKWWVLAPLGALLGAVDALGLLSWGGLSPSANSLGLFGWLAAIEAVMLVVCRRGIILLLTGVAMLWGIGFLLLLVAATVVGAIQSPLHSLSVLALGCFLLFEVAAVRARGRGPFQQGRATIALHGVVPFLLSAVGFWSAGNWVGADALVILSSTLGLLVLWGTSEKDRLRVTYTEADARRGFVRTNVEPPASTVCSDCGSKARNADRFCEACGKPLQQVRS